MLEAKEVNFAYLRGQPVLNDIDIKIESGEFVALLGHNGSGKTTLSRLFMALIHPLFIRAAGRCWWTARTLPPWSPPIWQIK